jgi:hypothetical protein
LQNSGERDYFVYILTSGSSVLNTGVVNDMPSKDSG